MKLYIAGPMSGYPEFNFPMFREAAKHLREEGYEVVSPQEMDEELDGFDGTGEHPNPDHKIYMARDLPRVVECDGIYLLPGWSQSKGALAELFTAIACGNAIKCHPDCEGVNENVPIFVNLGVSNE
jgi:nucleoside 2-deoxyribosyltransferase